MKRLLKRLLGLARQSRIRLSASDFRIGGIQIGDRLEIGSRLWQVRRPAADPPAAVPAAFDLVAVGGPPAEARLRLGPTDLWQLEQGAGALLLAPGDVLHYRVSSPANSAECPRL